MGSSICKWIKDISAGEDFTPFKEYRDDRGHDRQRPGAKRTSRNVFFSTLIRAAVF